MQRALPLIPIGVGLVIVGIAITAVTHIRLASRMESLSVKRAELERHLITAARGAPTYVEASGSKPIHLPNLPAVQQAMSNAGLRNVSLHLTGEGREGSRATLRGGGAYDEVKKLLAEVLADQAHLQLVAVKLNAAMPDAAAVQSEMVLEPRQ